MSEIKMLNVGSLPSIPWQDRPADLKTETPVWRYSENPVLGRNPTPEIASRSTAFPMFTWDIPKTVSTGTWNGKRFPSPMRTATP